MGIKLRSLFVIGFFVAQLISYVHVAEFGVLSHEHQGQECEILYHADLNKSYLQPVNHLLHVRNSLLLSSKILPDHLIIFKRRSTISPRAPPALS